MSDPKIRVIEGCRHQIERMTEWANNGACPICLTAELGMANKRIAALENGITAFLDSSRHDDHAEALRAVLTNPPHGGGPSDG